MKTTEESESAYNFIGMPYVRCEVLPLISTVAAMPELADATAISPCDFVVLMMALKTLLFPVPAGPSRKNTVPALPGSMT